MAALKHAPCQLLATQLSPPDGPRQLYMLQRWLPLVLHIRRKCGTPLGCAGWHAWPGWRSTGVQCAGCLHQAPATHVHTRHARLLLSPLARRSLLHAAAAQSHTLAVLSPRPDVPPACLQQLQFSLKHGSLALEAMLPAQAHTF